MGMFTEEAMTSGARESSAEIEPYLARHPSFGGWREEWDVVPLEFRVCLSDELPPRKYVGSVRAVVLRNDEVLLVHSAPPILSVGGRCELGETLWETLLREVGEESGWLVTPIAVLGFIHCRHLDEQRPDWGRPAPDFIDPVFAVAAGRYDPARLKKGETSSEFVAITAVAGLGVGEINQTFLREALRKRSEKAALPE